MGRSCGDTGRYGSFVRLEWADVVGDDHRVCGRLAVGVLVGGACHHGNRDDGLGDTPTRLSRMTSSSVFVMNLVLGQFMLTQRNPKRDLYERVS